jgi:transcriptional regulator of acetoin/glycerol metabolism
MMIDHTVTERSTTALFERSDVNATLRMSKLAWTHCLRRARRPRYHRRHRAAGLADRTDIGPTGPWHLPTLRPKCKTIVKAHDNADDNKPAVTRRLGSSRTTLCRRMAQYRIDEP